MLDSIPLHTTVALLEEVEADGVQLQRGESGCVIEERAPLVYELEMRDEEGRGYAFATVHASQVLVLHHAGTSDGSRERHGVWKRAKDEGIDLPSLRRNLDLTPEERLKKFQNSIVQVGKLRKAVERMHRATAR